MISSFASCPQAQQPQCWLLALFQPHSCRCPRTGYKESTGASHLPSQGILSTPSYLSVPFIHRAVHGEGNGWEGKERAGVTPLLRGEPSHSWPSHWGSIHPMLPCYLSKLSLPKRVAEADFVSTPRLLSPGWEAHRGCTEKPYPFPLRRLLLWRGCGSQRQWL